MSDKVETGTLATPEKQEPPKHWIEVVKAQPAPKVQYFLYTKDSFQTVACMDDFDAESKAALNPDVIKLVCSKGSRVVFQK